MQKGPLIVIAIMFFWLSCALAVDHFVRVPGFDPATRYWLGLITVIIQPVIGLIALVIGVLQENGEYAEVVSWTIPSCFLVGLFLTPSALDVRFVELLVVYASVIALGSYLARRKTGR